MTILCITTEGLPGIRPCTHLGDHRVTCQDHPGWTDNPGTCRGCLPRKADRGYLCDQCYERVVDAHHRWAPFRRLVIETEGRAVTADGGGIKSAAPEGYTNLPLTFLALDECDRLLRSLTGRTLDVWVSTEDGARDAVLFAHAAERAYRSLEVEKRDLQLERVRCPQCGSLTLTGHTTREHRGAVIVECQYCGELLDKIRSEYSRWVGSETCRNDDPLVHLACDRVTCECDCHILGRASQEMGVSSLWNADMHTASPASAPRADWVIDDAMTIRRQDAGYLERKIA